MDDMIDLSEFYCMLMDRSPDFTFNFWVEGIDEPLTARLKLNTSEYLHMLLFFQDLGHEPHLGHEYPFGMFERLMVPAYEATFDYLTRLYLKDNEEAYKEEYEKRRMATDPAWEELTEDQKLSVVMTLEFEENDSYEIEFLTYTCPEPTTTNYHFTLEEKNNDNE